MKPSLNVLPNALLFLGLLVFIGGASSYYQSKRLNPDSAQSSSRLVDEAFALTERKLAIAEAVKNRQSTYSFSSSFIPGIGKVPDPEAYKQSWYKKVQSKFAIPNAQLY